MSNDDDLTNPSRRAILTSSAALVGASVFPQAQANALSALPQNNIAAAPELPPQGYNILFILVDQERFFPKWPFPVPAREWLKKNGVTFNNHQIGASVCSPARSVIYTGQHIQHTGVFDLMNYLWQPDMSTKVRTVGDRLQQLGYYPVYQGKWHLSYNLDQARRPFEAPVQQYRKILESYGFKDFFGYGDIIDRELGGYRYDADTASIAITWMRTEGEKLRAEGKPWFMALNFVNPHDVMYIDTDLPGRPVQGKKHTLGIAPPPDDEIYSASWDGVPLPSTRSQPLDAPGRPKAHKIYVEIEGVFSGEWPDEDRRWRLLQNYYFNCIRDCDRQVMRVLEALKAHRLDKNTIVVFTSDHGEYGGHHQMRGKGNSAYRQQNHVPLMIYHPAYSGGVECNAVTSQIDLAPTILGLTGLDKEKIKQASAGLKGRDISALLKSPATAKEDTLRSGALFCFDMLLFQDAFWITNLYDFMESAKVPDKQKIKLLTQKEPNFHHRVSMRSAFDGRYRFSRYFSPLQFNTPTTMEELLARNDLELFDHNSDPEEVDNLAMKPKEQGELIMALNAKLNTLVANEVGVDDGSFLPIRNGKWRFPPKSER